MEATARAFGIPIDGDGVKSWVDAGIPRAHHLGVLRGLQNRGFGPTLRVFGLMNWAKLPGCAHDRHNRRVEHEPVWTWEIIHEERVPYELSSGSFVLLEVDGVLRSRASNTGMMTVGTIMGTC
jgi:hypothetical protein